MSSSSTPPVPAAPASAPPPGCPAHRPEGPAAGRLYGADAEADPMALYTRLREEYGAVAPVLVPGDVEAWLVLGHAENLEVLRSPHRFSSDPVHFARAVAPDHPVAPLTTRQSLINFADGEQHGRLRGAVSDSLARFNRRGIRQHITRSANALIDGFAATGSADLVAEFARTLPMLVMTRLLGLTDVPAERLAQACRDLLQATETAVASSEFLLTTLQDLVERAKAEPGAEFCSWLMQHEAGLADEEVVHHLRQILVASNEGTVNLIADTLRVMLTDERFRARLAGGNMTLADALDDVLWNNSPLGVLPARWATEDTRLGEQEIRKGDWVLNGLAAGNVDPLIRPDLAESMQGNRSHLAFSSGPHECPGQSIALSMAELSIDVLLSRLPDLKIAAPPERLTRTPTWTSSHLDALPVEFTPREVDRRVADQLASALSSDLPAERPLPAAVPPPAPRPASWWRRVLGRD